MHDTLLSAIIVLQVFECLADCLSYCKQLAGTCLYFSDLYLVVWQGAGASGRTDIYSCSLHLSIPSFVVGFAYDFID